MLHAYFTGGEPLARMDLTELVSAARTAGLYTNLITSGVGLNDQRLAALMGAGLDHIQISFQDSREESANWIAGAKACMGGWGQRLMLINPSGKVLPCHAAEVLPQMSFENVRDRPLQWIWEKSESFQRFRGESWMPEPCRSCDHRAEDFGGCRCQ